MFGLGFSISAVAARRPGKAAGASTPWSISALGSALGLYATATRAALVSSAVALLPSFGGGLGVAQATAANRGTLSSGAVLLDGTNDSYSSQPAPVPLGDVVASAVTLPDVATSVAGKGPTCTGLALASDGTWWVGDDGRSREDDGNLTTFPSGVIHYSADFSTVLLDVRCSVLGLGTSLSVQGVACLSGHGQVAFSHCLSSSSSSKVEIIDEATGAYVGSAFGGATITGLNGLAYDASLDALIVHTVSGGVSTATWYARAAADLSAPIKSCTLTGGADADHLHYDGARGWLWWSVGANGSDGLLYARALTDITTDILVFVAKGATAVEGLAVTASDIVVACDGYYHLQTTALNQARRYALPVLPSSFPPSYPTGSRIVVAAIAKLTAAITASKPVWMAGGNPTSGATTGACGVYFVGSTGGVSNQIRAFMNAANVTWTLASGDFLTEKLIFVDFDMVAKTAELFVAGVSQGKQTFASGTATALAQSKAYIGTLLGGTPWLPGSIAAIGYAAGTAAQTADLRQRIEGFMAWDTGRAALLDASHPYASAAP